MKRVLSLLALWLFAATAAQAAPFGAGDGNPAPRVEAPRPVTILVLGDSVTSGYGLPSEQSFPSVLESLLLRGGYRVNVINAGVSGDTTTEGLARLATYFPPKAQARPDIVIMELGANDGLQGKDPAQVEENLDAMLAKIQAEGAKILLIGARAVRGKSPEYSQAFAEIFPRMATKYDATLYPFLGTGIFGNPEFVQQDKSHPNEKGARIIAENLYPLVVGLIAKTVQ